MKFKKSIYPDTGMRNCIRMGVVQCVCVCLLILVPVNDL